MAERRWYDKDPILKEALELLKIACDENRVTPATEFMLQLQEEVAAEVLEHVYEIVSEYQGKGNRWYDKDPVISKTVELLRVVPPDVQRHCAIHFINALNEMGVEYNSPNLKKLEQQDL